MPSQTPPINSIIGQDMTITGDLVFDSQIQVDGAVDGNRINTLLPTLKDDAGEDGLLRPDAIAENYWHIHRQSRSAWTHELDVRPWAENW